MNVNWISIALFQNHAAFYAKIYQNTRTFWLHFSMSSCRSCFVAEKQFTLYSDYVLWCNFHSLSQKNNTYYKSFLMLLCRLAPLAMLYTSLLQHLPVLISRHSKSITLLLLLPHTISYLLSIFNFIFFGFLSPFLFSPSRWKGKRVDREALQDFLRLHNKKTIALVM